MSLKKTAKVESPHAIYVGGQFEYRVLKAYSTPAGEAKNRYARWFLGTRSPYTYGEFELGDDFVRDVKENAVLVAATDEFLAAYGLDRVNVATIESYVARKITGEEERK
jgi:hypothetical protein